MDEFELIKKYFYKLTNSCEESLSLKDDVAKIVIDKNQQLILSKDLAAEDIHFFTSQDPYKISSKLLRSNLSDIASAGAKPLYYMLGFSKNSHVNEDFVKKFCQGLEDVATQYKISLIGGDTIRTNGKLIFSITIFGVTQKNQHLRRDQAYDSDLIFVSENIGDSFLGLKILQKEINNLPKIHQDYLLNRHYFPEPRIELGMALLEKKLSICATDISDGLISDLEKICISSNLGATIYQDKIPISSSAKFCLDNYLQFSTLDLFSGGEDYELIFVVKPQNREFVRLLARDLDIKISEIGFFKEDGRNNEVSILDVNNHKIPFSKAGYVH